MVAPIAVGSEMPAAATPVTTQFAEVFESQRRRALRLAYILTGDADLSEDVVADVLVAMYPHWRRGRVDDVDAYVRRAIVNRVNTVFRRREVQRRHDRTERPSVEPAADAGLNDRDLVQRALLSLPLRQRAAVALRYLDDQSEADTALTLGVSVGTVKSQVSRALDRLRQVLSTEGDPR